MCNYFYHIEVYENDYFQKIVWCVREGILKKNIAFQLA